MATGVAESAAAHRQDEVDSNPRLRKNEAVTAHSSPAVPDPCSGDSSKLHNAVDVSRLDLLIGSIETEGGLPSLEPEGLAVQNRTTTPPTHFIVLTLPVLEPTDVWETSAPEAGYNVRRGSILGIGVGEASTVAGLDEEANQASLAEGITPKTSDKTTETLHQEQ